jgi:type VI secretion system secreted protein VgrG
MSMVPQLWFLTKVSQSRIFQQVPVPEILSQVLKGLDVDFKLTGAYEPRDYCVQYRETDFNFVSRLMEEEGIAYFFKHSERGHTLVVYDSPGALSEVPEEPAVTYGGSAEGVHGENRISDWSKSQELRSGSYTLWDHCFELPHKHLEAGAQIINAVAAGEVTHKLRVGNSKLEIYDYPGEYAQRFDGVNPGGGDRPADIQKIFADNKRTVELRMQEEATHGLVIRGASTCRHFVSGHTFELEKHYNANGHYLLTSVQHSGRSMMNYRSGDSEEFVYQNQFTCTPMALPFRPARKTPKPVVQGTQTAVVVGPPGEEIFTDKYGRVKVQFHWDRNGKNNADSSCWVRVGTPWAGKNWGMIHIPRVGQEVIVDFQEGDPDQPIIIGSVYNADMMPPYDLPANKTQSGVKSRSTLKGTPANFNELRFEDKKGSEDIYFHAEKDFHRVVENDDDLKVGNDQTIEVANNRTEVVQKGNEKVTVEKGDRTVTLGMGNDTHHVKMGNRDVKIDMGNDALTIKMGNQAMQSIELKVGQSSIKLDQMGVTIKGMKVSVEGQILTEVKGLMTNVNATAILQVKGGLTMIG